MTGNPEPIVTYNLTDISGGSLGKNKIQVNLQDGQNTTLIATAENNVGSKNDSKDLSWVNESEIIKQVAFDIYNNISSGLNYSDKRSLQKYSGENTNDWRGGFDVYKTGSLEEWR